MPGPWESLLCPFSGAKEIALGPRVQSGRRGVVSTLELRPGDAWEFPGREVPWARFLSGGLPGQVCGLQS